MRGSRLQPGQRFDRLVVVKSIGVRRRYNHYLCRCDCGNEVEVRSARLSSGNTRSCGCLRTERRINQLSKHGGYGTPTYQSWRRMKERCLNPENGSYPRYGGRGVTVCERWMSFKNFLADMGERPKGMTLERRDNDGNYEPDNCVWATPKQQARNRSDNRVITFQGETMILSDWADRTGISFGTLSGRLNKQHWSIERALTTPVRVNKASIPTKPAGRPRKHSA